MARRRQKPRSTLLDDALAADWPVSAILAAVCFFGPRVLAAVAGRSPFVQPLVMVATLIGSVMALLFGLIAAVKLGKRLLAPPAPHFTADAPAPTRTVLKGELRSEPSLNIATPPAARPPVSAPAVWSLDVLHRIEWKRFEDLCCAYYQAKGIRARTTPLGPDGGVDIHLFQNDAAPERPTAIVQCKAHNSRIGVKPIRELRGVMAHAQVDKAFFMAPGGFTDEARAFAGANRITLLDDRLFLALLVRLPAEVSQQLLAQATEGDWTTPSCPECGQKLVARKSARGPLWGYRAYPRCRGMIPMRQAEATAHT